MEIHVILLSVIIFFVFPIMSIVFVIYLLYLLVEELMPKKLSDDEQIIKNLLIVILNDSKNLISGNITKSDRVKGFKRLVELLNFTEERHEKCEELQGDYANYFTEINGNRKIIDQIINLTK